jgi:hypothetical protein
MINLIRADLYCISKMISVKICLILCCISAIIISFVLHGISAGDFDTAVGTSVSLMTDVMLVSLLGGVLIGGFILGDFETKNIHCEIISGRGRMAIILSKLFSSAALILIITLPYGIVSVIGFTSDIEFGPLVGIPSSFFEILSNTSGVEVTGASIIKSIILCLLIMYVYIGRLSVCIPIAFKCKKSIPVIITGFITAFLFDIISALAVNIDILSDILSCLPYSLTYDLTMGAPASMLIKAFVCNTIFIAIMFGISHQIFRKDEIK